MVVVDFDGVQKPCLCEDDGCLFNNKNLKILSLRWFDILRYSEDPNGKDNFTELRRLYAGLSPKIKKEIIQNALLLSSCTEDLINRMGWKKSISTPISRYKKPKIHS